MAGKGISKTLVWILMGLLILGLGGFGVTNLSGTVRNVGSVGEAEIGMNEYARALQNEIRALEAERGAPVSFAQAQQAGLDSAVLSQLVAAAAFEDETRRLGISVGDDHLRAQITKLQGFQGLDGEFDREAYRFALEQAGLSEAEFEADYRAESASALLQGAVLAGVQTPAPYTATLLDYLAEARSITWAEVEEADLEAEIPAPTGKELAAYHEANPDEFTTPETKRITYAWLTPEMIIDSVEIDEDTLRAAYEDRAETYRQPERRLVERLVFPDAETAQAARERIEAGEASFEEVVEARGLDLVDIDLGDVSRADLGAAAEPVFAAGAGEIAGPAETDLGPALFRVNAVLAAQETSFEEAEPELRDTLAADRARRVIEAQVDTIDDLLAGGATIEDLAKETEMELGEIAWHPGMSEEIAAYTDFREAAAEADPDGYPEVLQLDEGGIFALRVDEILEPALQPLDKVRDAVTEAWRAHAVETALQVQLGAEAGRLEKGGDFEALGLRTRTADGLTRRAFPDSVPVEFSERVFAMSEGDVEVIPGEGRVYLLRLDTVTAADPEDGDLASLRDTIENQTANSVAQDLYQVLADDIRGRAGIELDQQALNAVHSNFQ